MSSQCPSFGPSKPPIKKCRTSSQASRPIELFRGFNRKYEMLSYSLATSDISLPAPPFHPECMSTKASHTLKPLHRLWRPCLQVAVAVCVAGTPISLDLVECSRPCVVGQSISGGGYGRNIHLAPPVSVSEWYSECSLFWKHIKQHRDLRTFLNNFVRIILEGQHVSPYWVKCCWYTTAASFTCCGSSDQLSSPSGCCSTYARIHTRK